MPVSIVIRRCQGNKSAWGAFIDNANEWCMGTALSLDGLTSMLVSRYSDSTYRATWRVRLELEPTA